MIKIIIPRISFLLLNKLININILLILFIIYSIIKFTNLRTHIRQILYFDNISIIIIILTLIRITLITLSTNLKKNSLIIIYSIIIILIITFFIPNIFYFYIIFELVLIPTTILIIKLGIQPERLQAGIYLIIYTISASLPLLVRIILIKNNLSFNFSYIIIFKFKITIILLLAFLVKIPIFFTHL